MAKTPTERQRDWRDRKRQGVTTQAQRLTSVEAELARALALMGAMEQRLREVEDLLAAPRVPSYPSPMMPEPYCGTGSPPQRFRTVSGNDAMQRFLNDHPTKPRPEQFSTTNPQADVENWDPA